MPRGPRLDCPGALHHVIVRGIERRKIFYSERDRSDVLNRLATLVIDTQAGLYAWSLMPNQGGFGGFETPMIVQVIQAGMAIGTWVSRNLISRSPS